MATIVLAIHLGWILWVLFGAFWTRGRPLLTTFHLTSVMWGIAVELAPVDCPLTLAEQFFESKAGIDPYRSSFLMHYLDRLVYPDLPGAVLVSCGVAACLFNLLIYLRRYWVHRNARSSALSR